MLNQVRVSNAVQTCVVEYFAYNTQLVVAWKVQGLGGFSGVSVLFFDEFGKVFNDSGQALGLEDVFPQVGGFVAVWVGWVAFAVVVAFVEGEEVSFFAV